MNRFLRTLGVAATLIAGGLNLTGVCAQQPPGAALVAGDKPVTEDQVRAKLQTDGWSNVQISREGHYFQVTASKDGQAGKLIVDAQTGRLRVKADNDDDDD